MPLIHDFWLLREGEEQYTCYREFVARKDAPVRFNDDLLRYVSDTLVWIPTLNPAKEALPMGYGLNWYGPTIINQTGGALFHKVCTSWAHLFQCGPKELKLQGLFSWQWPFEESEHLISEDQLSTVGSYDALESDRDALVHMFTTLAGFGEQAATGRFFVLHIGI
jgi:hypothetical protein